MQKLPPVFVVVPALILSLCMSSAAMTPSDPTTSPDFGPRVLVFDPSMEDVQARVDEVFRGQETAQFGPGRYALLFKPGKYRVSIEVGFYTQVTGLGRTPDDVEIVGALQSTARWRRGNATCNFWRCAENLSVTPANTGSVNVWAVSQGTALRRVHMRGDLDLSDHGWSSGGFIADSVIDGTVDSGSQQQWLTRNAELGHWRGGNWNMVFVGVTNPPCEPPGDWATQPYTVIERTPVIREKPYLFIDDAGGYAVMVPELSKPEGSRGTTWKALSDTRPAGGRTIPIDRFHIARPDRDSAASMNAALTAGLSLILTPGTYQLDEAIRVGRSGTVVLGLGYPTLITTKGTEAVVVGDVDGVCVAGVLLEAGPSESPTLLRVGTAPRAGAPRVSHERDPIVLSDVFCRAGGAAVGVTKAMVAIHSNNVIGDNLWLWRADHGQGAAWEANRNASGLIVDGDDVTIYGLFVEHTQEYQTIWNGERGRVYFYQSEMPYDPPSPESWSHAGVRGYASYKVADHVRTHEAWGLGVYCVFWKAAVIAETAIEAPDVEGVKLRHLIAVRLNGVPGSGINRVKNGEGEPVITGKTAKLD